MRNGAQYNSLTQRFDAYATGSVLVSMDRSVVEPAVDEIFNVLLKSRPAGGDATVDRSKPLHDGGYELDSIEIATLAALLGERFGDDPWLSGELPATLNEVIDYYERS